METSKYTKGKVDNNLKDGNVYCGGVVVANCYSSFLSPETVKANADRFTKSWNEYDSLKEENEKLEKEKKLWYDSWATAENEKDVLEAANKELLEALDSIEKRTSYLDDGVNKAGDFQISHVWKLAEAMVTKHTQK